jgi:uncharacterized protein (DUF58 family)
VTASLFKKLRRRRIRKPRIYIMPSGYGVVFLTIDLVFVMVGATYNNNLIFILAFLLFSIFVVSMLETHINMKSIKLKFKSAEETFVGEPMALFFQITQDGKRTRRQIIVRCANKSWGEFPPERVDLRSDEPTQPVKLTIQVRERGAHEIPAIIVETYFPMGLFRAWQYFRVPGEFVAYPRPEGLRVLTPRETRSGQEELGVSQSPDGDFGELRSHRVGESYHQIAWKHYARTGHLYSKVHWGSDRRHYDIPWDPRGLELESYLRQMSRWVQAATLENASFSMNLPSLEIESGEGQDQARICWRALARFKVAR